MLELHPAQGGGPHTNPFAGACRIKLAGTPVQRISTPSLLAQQEECAVSKAGAEDGAGNDVAEEVHTEKNSGNTYAEGAEHEAGHQAGEEETHRNGEGKGGYGVAGGKGELVRR